MTRPERIWHPASLAFLAAAWLGAVFPFSSAHGQSLGAKDLDVLGRAMGFLQPQPEPGGVLAIAYVAGDAASHRDAEAIAAQIGPVFRAGGVPLTPRLVEVGGVAGSGARIVIAASGANGAALSAATRGARALCVTADADAVRAGQCAMSITTSPRVDIVVNHVAVAASGLDFAAAFRMMIREI